ncbi:branched-chain amino acid aminotransferase [Pelagibacterium halotolerans]|uniref:Branched-chain-amino-acid aminotransferase n=1 Tax=Pelagibacterium halotolerans (strain DSM 22347 / JCM 15775 / CGMCC 1.7692 / B2) TaxID=1082931 RepID=G4R681_PELHB|nr:branched-chain amino acid aminotransferase [Pelagibacterium halotolerans]AEQ52174.1 branched-chain amino acid aminotransferase [Pelagibacterium halotolerans B2]QJR18065.1 branched-chain amino acid aminotransferase [Pelagibacterium halotolerans]SDZ85040.1 branched chain amino acid aminotransferase apoenzyme [Pelagibacterium halotolerans]
MATVPMDQRDGWIWYNGEMVPWKDAKLHVLTHGLHYASSVFEGQRAYGGEVFKLREHTERLIFSGKTLDFTIPYSADEIDEACRQVLAKNNLVDAYMRPVAWRGSETLSVPARDNKVHLAIAAWVWPSYFSTEERLKGIRLCWADWKRPSPETIPCKAKAAGLYMICTLSKHAAMDKGYADALMLDYRGYVAEATGANVFFVKGKDITTPLPDCFLDGITRRTLIGLAKANGYTVTERHIKPEELAEFDECFLTGTAAEVTPVSEVGEYKFTPADACRTLVEAYMSEVQPKQAAAE